MCMIFGLKRGLVHAVVLCIVQGSSRITFSSGRGGRRRSMEEKGKGAGAEPLEEEQQQEEARAARPAKRRFGAVGPPPS
ncbi:hypothetical protein EJB05_19436 [Eragrostis curvula]|uniref:Uncharacterized protein n=1 Tax=Eragrostis curvula TaxID=38414 RepID=A0A5J9UW02_9POAL|nr:hypothetical protein EJB05_19436 [Eragrostis curvula]